jgi:hypothetical protein
VKVIGHLSITSPSRTWTASYSTVSVKPELSAETIYTVSSRSETNVMRGVNGGNAISRTSPNA